MNPEDPEIEDNLNEEPSDETTSEETFTNHGDILPVSGLFKNWFIDYASYVILERAVPAIEDGLKPVQRRILHAIKEMDDGRFNKVANVIGSTMQYHPHGDAAIGEALVNLGQKELFFDMQGNWGDIRTGDSAAAPRYIEVRLSKFALDVVFNPDLTEWQLSYDGRKKEPVTLPVKFPLLLAQGVEGIAVGLSTKIMPHNFIELCEASIDVLKGKKPNIVPDFMTGGYADFTMYNEGRKGSRVRIRAKIEEKDKNTLLVKEIPFSTTTGSIIDSILKAVDNGKIKIKKVIDNTAKELEIELQLAPGTSPDKTIDALYAFTDCEVSISPAACVIANDKPRFLSVNDMLVLSTEHTLGLIKSELEIDLNGLEEDWHFSSLEKIFIENRIYRDIEECETWESVLEMIDKGLEPFKKLLRREITTEDIAALTEIKIKRISKFDGYKADERLRNLEDQIAQLKHHLEHLTDYAIEHFKNLIKKYGKGRERKTEQRVFDDIEANVVAIANLKLYANKAEGFVGFGLKKDELICDCSDIDDIIAFRKDGKYIVSKVSEKQFMGKDLIHIDVFRKNDDRCIYNVAYFDGASKKVMVKRFNVTGVIRDKEYDITQGTKGSYVMYFTANKNGEAEKVSVFLSHTANARVKQFEYDFATLAIKGKSSQGNALTKHPVRKIELKEKGRSTMGGRKIWYEPEIGRLNTDGFGTYLGEFDGDDKILVINNDGSYELTNYEIVNRYEPKEIYLIQKFHPKQPIYTVHYAAKQDKYFAKVFLIETTTLQKKFIFITEEPGSKMNVASTSANPEIEIKVEGKEGKEVQKINLADITELKGWKSNGSKLTNLKVRSVKLLSDKVGEYVSEQEPEVEFEVMGTNETPDAEEKIQPKSESIEFEVEDKRNNPDEYIPPKQLNLL